MPVSNRLLLPRRRTKTAFARFTLLTAFAVTLLLSVVGTLESAPQNRAIRTALCRINVNQAGRVANQEALNDMWFFPDSGAPGYLFDGSLILGNSANSLSWLIFEGLGGGPTGSNPFGYMQELSPTTDYDSLTFPTYRIASGTGQNSDGSLSFQVDYYAFKHPDSGEFIIAHFDVTTGPANPSGTVSDLTVAFASDWNIPSDVANMNTSDFDAVKSLLYLQSTGTSTDRLGATTAYRDDGGDIIGGFVWDNATHVDPLATFENDDLWGKMESLSMGQFDTAPGTDDFTTVIVIGRDLIIDGSAADTFSFSVLLLAEHQPLLPDKNVSESQSLVGLQETHDKAVKAMCEYDISPAAGVCDSCSGQLPGDVDNSGVIGTSDIIHLVQFLCVGGPPPPVLANGDPDGDCDIDSCDIQYLNNYIFFGGPPPVPCTCDSPTVIGCSCNASGPDLCQNSTTDPVFLICPGGDAAFHVFLKDENGDAVVGDSSVVINFSGCSGIVSCPPSVPLTSVSPIAPSDADGKLTFFFAGGGCNTNCMAQVVAPCGTIATVPVRTFDINGDMGVSLGFDFDLSECNNYNGVPGPQFQDQQIFSDHIDHYCGLDPCDRFQAEFFLEPDYNLAPGEVIDLTLVLKNNNFDACAIGFIVFSSSGFGTGEDTELIQNYNYGQSLPPGSEDTVTIQYTVPGIGHGCLTVSFVTSCCSTAVELTECAQSTWHCASDAGLCYETIILLEDTDITAITIVDDFLPPGWFVNVLHVPSSFPITLPDSIMYQTCTPEEADLGDDAHVFVYVEHSSGPTDEFETSVFITPRTGDANGDCLISISDAVYIINFIFAGGPAPIPCQAGDVDCSGIVTISDVVYLINFIFAGGGPPCVPDESTLEPTCGVK